jgi:hypothetical protein
MASAGIDGLGAIERRTGKPAFGSPDLLASMPISRNCRVGEAMGPSAASRSAIKKLDAGLRSDVR